MIACVSPGQNSSDHTINTLRYAERLKERNAYDYEALARAQQEGKAVQDNLDNIRVVEDGDEPEKDEPEREELEREEVKKQPKPKKPAVALAVPVKPVRMNAGYNAKKPKEKEKAEPMEIDNNKEEEKEKEKEKEKEEEEGEGEGKSKLKYYYNVDKSGAEKDWQNLKNTIHAKDGKGIK